MRSSPESPEADRGAERRRARNAARNRRYRRRKKTLRRLEKRHADQGLLFREYDDLIAAIVHRRRALGLSQLAMDHVTGLPDGYQGKLEAKVKAFGPKSLPLVLQALGLKLAVIPDANAPKWQIASRQRG